jgi:hypothetical protein
MATVVRAPNKNEAFEVAQKYVASTASQLSSVSQELASTAAALMRGIFDADPMQTMFVGYVRDYRYTAGREGEAPSHRFYIECKRGTWLYARVPSSLFEPLMQDMAMEIVPVNVNGQMIVVRADADTNSLMPIGFVQDLGRRDRFGNLLFFGAPVIAGGDIGVAEGRDGDEVSVTLELSGVEAVFAESEIARRF